MRNFFSGRWQLLTWSIYHQDVVFLFSREVSGRICEWKLLPRNVLNNLRVAVPTPPPERKTRTSRFSSGNAYTMHRPRKSVLGIVVFCLFVVDFETNQNSLFGERDIWKRHGCWDAMTQIVVTCCVKVGTRWDKHSDILTFCYQFRCQHLQPSNF